MHIGNRFVLLVEDHRNLEEEVAAEMSRPMPDQLVLQQLKRQKLRIKDEIERWRRLSGRLHAGATGKGEGCHA